MSVEAPAAPSVDPEPQPGPVLRRPRPARVLTAHGSAPVRLAGTLAAAVVLGVSELGAGLLSGAERPVIALGDLMVRVTPEGIREAVIGGFGTDDKPFLITSVVVVTLLLGSLLGSLAARRRLYGDIGVVALAAAATAAGLRSNGSPGPQVLLGVGLAMIGVTLLRLLVPAAVALWVAGEKVAAARAAEPVKKGPAPRTAQQRNAARKQSKGTIKAQERQAVDRRDFIIRASSVAVLGGVAVLLSRAVRASNAVQAIRAKLGLPTVADAATALPDGAMPAVAGVRPVITPNSDFYRVDVSLSTPQVDPTTYVLKVGGLVDTEISLSYDQLAAMPQISRRVTIGCVGNEVGGPQIGTALWQGVRMADVLQMAGPTSSATQLSGVSVDGYTSAMPIGPALDGRDAMLAIGMNGEPLPVEHGFPVRMIVPGYYGYASAVKWLSELRLEDDSFQAFWVERGYAVDAPFRTQSQIDVPRGTVAAGTVSVAGFAWAPHRGISAVEVSVDGGDWQAATLAADLDADTWRGWSWSWPATSGRHTLQVRATDGAGTVQDGTERDVLPDGATGYHTVRVSVS